MELPMAVQNAIEHLQSNGFTAWAVGGCVRDRLLGRQPNDWDITTSARPEQIAACFPRHKLTGAFFGTVLVWQDDMTLEITTYRSDGEYADHRRPESVSFSDKVEEDLSRRDFTVNAMAYAPDRGLVDLFGGREDLENGVLRCVGEAKKRFEEDALRVLRLFRFAAQLQMQPDEEALCAAQQCAPYLAQVSRERITEEMRKLLQKPSRGQVLEQMQKRQVLRYALPVDSAEVLRRYEGDETGAWALLLHEKQEELANMRLPKSLCRDVETLWSAWEEESPKSLFSMRRSFGRLGKENCTRFLQIRQTLHGERIDWELLKKAENSCCRIHQLQIKGGDLAGCEGAQIGKTLQKLLDAVMEDQVENEKNALLEYYEKVLRNGVSVL